VDHSLDPGALFFFPESVFRAIFWRWPISSLPKLPLNLLLQNIQEAPPEIGAFPATSH
jgi:hypothetical protein